MVKNVLEEVQLSQKPVIFVWVILQILTHVNGARKAWY